MAKIQVGTVPPKKKKGYWRMTPCFTHKNYIEISRAYKSVYTKCVINNPQKFLKKKQYSYNINSLAMSVSTEVSTF